MSKPIIAIKTSQKNYSGLVDLSNRVASSLAGNLEFALPVPSILQLTAAVTDVTTAIAVWGPKGNRGSHDDLLNLRAKAITLSQLLRSMAEYVQNTAQLAAGNDYVEMAVIINSSGFKLRNTGTPQGVLQMVQNYHRFVSRQVNANQVKLKWKKPLNTLSAGNVKSYKVFRGTTPVLSAATNIDAISPTSFIDTNNTGATVTWSYWIVPVGAAGDGVASNVLTVIVPSA